MTIRNPPAVQAVIGPNGRIDPHWERWLGELVRAVNDSGTVTPTPAPDPVSFVINGAGSVAAEGSVAGGEFVVSLTGDKDSPPPTSFYGADASGNKGFVPAYNALEEGVGIALLDSGYTVIDEVASPDDLPLTGNTGEAVRVTGDEPGLYAWDGAAFTLDSAADGVVSVGLAELADAGTGAFKLLTRDAYGRLEGTQDGAAADVPYDNTASGMAATDVQGAIDEIASTGQGMTLIGSATVSGAAATTITVSGLDLATHGGYLILLNLGNATALAATVSLFYNGDTTATNYYGQFWAGVGASSTAARNNNAAISGLDPSTSINGVCELLPDIIDNYPRATMRINRSAPPSISIAHCAHVRSNGANVTSITISSSIASAFAIGSYVKVYKLG